ncbi:MAG: hypothetical protein R8K22_05085, partial [Mariprofundaceae bacterium]
HMKHIFHPIVGDTSHGDGKHNQLFREALNCSRLLLAATSLSFIHPVEQKEITLQAGLDDVFKTVIKRFNWQGACSL